MILKQCPEDFQVRELTEVLVGSEGPYSYYRLEKTGWTTPDALASLRRRWKLAPNRISYGGLKDRHAHTWQFLTIFHGPKRKLTHERIHLEYLGQLQEPFTSQQIRGNRFDLTLRDLNEAEWTYADSALNEVVLSGVPNYFDDQRFGSVSHGGEFIAKAMVLNDFEKALKLALAAPYEYDRSPQKKEKSILNSNWGDWPKLKELLDRGHARSLVTYLVDHPQDFRGAVARLKPELRGLYLSAYQSFLWNRILARWLMQQIPAEQCLQVRLRMGELPMPRSLTPHQLHALSQIDLPLPSARTRLEENDPLRQLIDPVLAEEGITLKQMQIKGIRDLFFSKGDRRAFIVPERIGWAAEPDESHSGKRKLKLSFELPRGSYATLIVKRITMQ